MARIGATRPIACGIQDTDHGTHGVAGRIRGAPACPDVRGRPCRARRHELGLSYGLTKLAFRGGGRSCSPARDSSPWRRSRSSCSPCSDDSARCSGRMVAVRARRPLRLHLLPARLHPRARPDVGLRVDPAPHHRAALLPALPVAGRQRACRHQWAGVGLATAGILLFMAGTSGGLRVTEARVGDLLSLGAAASFALYGIVNRRRWHAIRPRRRPSPARPSSAASPWRRSHWSTRADSRGARSR